MLRNISFFLFVALLFSACTNNPTPTEVTEQGEFFGEKISAENSLAFDQLMVKMEQSDSIATKVTGTVESVCKKKGCWVNLKSDKSDKELFVKFKDYGFFLPLDCEGREVVMEGMAFKEVTPVDELRHYAEDEGASEEEIAAITEPKEELKFLASGVILLPQVEEQK